MQKACLRLVLLVSIHVGSGKQRTHWCSCFLFITYLLPKRQVQWMVAQSLLSGLVACSANEYNKVSWLFSSESTYLSKSKFRLVLLLALYFKIHKSIVRTVPLVQIPDIFLKTQVLHMCRRKKDAPPSDARWFGLAWYGRSGSGSAAAVLAAASCNLHAVLGLTGHWRRVCRYVASALTAVPQPQHWWPSSSSPRFGWVSGSLFHVFYGTMAIQSWVCCLMAINSLTCPFSFNLPSSALAVCACML